jgi:ABC-type amino acid transport substrate-binding protein
MAQVALLWLSATLFSLPASAVQEVRIGAAHFPPYTVRPEKGSDTGLLPELVGALNQLQSVYHFVIVPTALPRRFQDLKQGRIDMSLFENPQWGWKDIEHVSVDMGLEDAEVFVALRKAGRDQAYFDSLDGKRLALFSGYHYAFAGFDAEPSWLSSHFNATLTYSHDSNLLMVLRERADIAPITRSYLTEFLAHNPQAADKLMMSERVDQVYHHYAILRPNAPISAEALRGYLRQLHENGDLQRIFQPLRISVLPMPSLSPPVGSTLKSKGDSE